jgi:hypothetical protein
MALIFLYPKYGIDVTTYVLANRESYSGFLVTILFLEIIKNKRMLRYVACIIILLPEETNKKGMEQKAMKLSKRVARAPQPLQLLESSRKS